MTQPVKKKRESRDGDHHRPIDYRNVELLKKHINPHARMFSRMKSNLSAKKQREFALAIKRARFMALLPYVGR